jgi:predicted ATPase
VLATSREPLDVPGERSWRVPSLRLPDPERAHTLEELEAFPAIQLFRDRAVAVNPGLALSEDNAQSIARICFRLDGLPLAIELAAARTRVLAPAQIEARLADALTLLATAPRGALTRQQTLEATLRWSHDLLEEQERILFRRLGVFAGSFGLEAVESVCSGTGLEPAEVVDVLGRLIDKSLVLAVERPGGYRYRLLETIRQYARQQLRGSLEERELEERHRSWCLAFVLATDPQLPGGPAELPVETIEFEHDNLRAALGSALERDPQAALELAMHVAPFWMARSHFTEGSRWVQAALERAPEPTAARAGALEAASGFDVRRGRWGYDAPVQEAVRIRRRLGDPAALGHALEQLATLRWTSGQIRAAEQLLDEAAVLAQEHSLPSLAAGVRNCRGLVSYGRADYGAAQSSFDEVRRLLAEAPRNGGVAFWPVAPGMLTIDELGNGRPRLFFEDTLVLFRRVEADRGSAYAALNLAAAARSAGAIDTAREAIDDALNRFRRLHDRVGTATALCALGNLKRTAGEFDLARQYLEESLALRQELGDGRGIRTALSGLGVAAGRAGAMAEARELILRAQHMAERTDDGTVAAYMPLHLGNLELDHGSPELAAQLLADAAPKVEAVMVARGSAWTWVTLAEASIRIAERDQAARAAATARKQLEALGERGGLARVASLDALIADGRLIPS